MKKNLYQAEVQAMNAGGRKKYSKLNAYPTKKINLLQLWAFPKERNVKAQNDQKSFKDQNKHDKFLTIVSPMDKNDGRTLWMHQLTYFNLGNFNAGKEID